jgi:nucleoside-triphosphatase THEP1
VGAGKSRFVEGLVGALRGAGLTIAGFLQRGVFGADGDKIGYDLVGLATGAVLPLARRSADGDRWLFDDAAFTAAGGEIQPGADLIVIDEVGHLELAGGGHTAAIDRALESAPVALIVVREALADLAEAWLSPRARVLRVRFERGRDGDLIAEVRAALAG